MPRVTEANEISKELRRGITFETKITPIMTKGRGMVSVVMVGAFCAQTPAWDCALCRLCSLCVLDSIHISYHGTTLRMFVCRSACLLVAGWTAGCMVAG